VRRAKRNTTILDIPKLNTNTDVEDTTGDEEVTRRQNIDRAEGRQKPKQQKDLEERHKQQLQEQTQKEHDEHIQRLENIREIYRTYEGNIPEYIRREISTSPKTKNDASATMNSLWNYYRKYNK